MVRKVILFVIYTAVFLLGVIYFAPKKNLYFLLEKELHNYGVVIVEKKIEEQPFSLVLSHVTLQYRGIDVAKIEEVSITSFFLLSVINAENIHLAPLVREFIPTKIEQVVVKHFSVYPLKVSFNGHGDFGVVDGEVDLQKRKLTLHLGPSKKMQKEYKKTLYRLKKDTNGGYRYDYSF